MIINNWRELIKYPQLLWQADARVIDILDTLHSLMPVKWVDDRSYSMIHWISMGKKCGLLNAHDESIIINEMIHGCGGM